MENKQIQVVIIGIVELEGHSKHHHDKPAPHDKHYACRVYTIGCWLSQNSNP